MVVFKNPQKKSILSLKNRPKHAPFFALAPLGKDPQQGELNLKHFNLDTLPRVSSNYSNEHRHTGSQPQNVLLIGRLHVEIELANENTICSINFRLWL